ncbi:TetR/AcrR family transcriptional regulator C-terminal domain-containing protein [Nocardia jinanensis]|uniref:TetR family transcriptional regulator n=1 Tax=Nocardia jinanensis TaxID=382504 RepID=A0A917R6S5_9NOCA|nr:TetR/AcrR family transcriptional regulator C-terminal domain-containing protein [Nocardia jinanensis]GGK92287.1 TetR family transcriptional regulator [Nocardia jinanensis]
MADQFSSVWTRTPRPPRTSGLDRERIVRAAVAILDKEGLDALSMRRLGAELGAGATSVYWHVANKNELLELALDEIWGAIDDAGLERASGLRGLLSTFAYNFRSALLAHPWSATLIGQIPSFGPQAFRLTERLRLAFTDAGFRGLDVYLASGTITSFVLGQVVPLIAMEKAHGGPVDQDQVRQILEQLSTDYPQMRADYRTLMSEDSALGNAIGFDFGLLCLLDGLEARLHAQQAADPANTVPDTADESRHP